MKKAILCTILGALVAICTNAPASATVDFKVVNATKYPVKVDIVFYTILCRNDHFTVGPYSDWKTFVGGCKIKSFTAVMTDPTGAHRCPVHNDINRNNFVIVNSGYQTPCAVR